MKFSINREELQNALGIVSKGAATRSTLPILSGILFSVHENALTLTSTNLDLSVKCTVPAFVEEEGETVIPSKLVGDVVKSLPEAAVFFESHEDAATVLCDTASFSLKTLDAEDFPAFPEVSPDASIAVPFQTFTRMVKRVSKVVSRDESRAILTGVLIEAHDGALRMVATDSYRLAVTDADFTGAANDFNAVIAGGFLSDLASLPETSEEIELAVSENQIVATYGETTFVNRRIEGTYPRYEKLIPESHQTRVRFNTKQLADAVKRVSVLSNRTAPVKFDLNGASNTVQISTASQDMGAARETLGCEIEGDDAEIAFNFSYVLDGLASVETDSVYLELQGSMRPGIFKAEEQERYLYLIMPVRLS